MFNIVMANQVRQFYTEGFSDRSKWKGKERREAKDEAGREERKTKRRKFHSDSLLSSLTPLSVRSWQRRSMLWGP